MEKHLVGFCIFLMTFAVGVSLVNPRLIFQEAEEFKCFAYLHPESATLPEAIPIELTDGDSNEVVATEEFPFKEYPVTEFYKGKNAKLKLTKEEKRLLGGRLQYTIENKKVDFAGHYIMAIWSCGMWCTASAIIDAKTGKVFGWNGILTPCFPDLDKDFACNPEFSNIEYRADSSLIVFFGHIFRDERDETGVRGFHYYNFRNGRLKHLKSVRVQEQRSSSQIHLDSIEANRKPT
jgi:hypothetical protein